MRKLSKKTDFIQNYSVLIVGISLLFFLYFITRGIQLPYVGYNAWNFNTYSLIARNYNLFGYKETKFAPIVSVSSTLPQKPTYYLHHPPLLSVIESILFRILGESFWVGRLTVILFSSASVLLLFFIAKNLYSTSVGIMTTLVAILMPGTVVFGRMIGQEPLVLFFALSGFYAVRKYFTTEKNRFFYLAVASIILGTLSDWQMVYFTALLCVLFFVKKEWKKGLLLLGIAGFTEVLFLSYVYWLMGGFSDLLRAISNRSLGELLSIHYWPFRWIGLILLRMLLYFNPLFVAFSIFVLLQCVKTIKKKKSSFDSIVLILFFLFGLLNVILYPEGSFGHAYWIYFFIPFIALSAGFVLQQLYEKKRFLWLGAIILFSFVFLVGIERWKRKEVETNVWRYELMRDGDKFLKPYERILVNPESVIDQDLINYAFKHTVTAVPQDSLLLYKNSYSHYLYSCMGCNESSPELIRLKNAYESQFYSKGDGILLVVFLDKPKNLPLQKINEPSKPEQKKHDATTHPPESVFRKLYRELKSILMAPQI